jgi:signal transduction histidine kinase
MLLQETTNMLRNSCGNISSLLLATKLTESKEETRRHLCDLNMMVEEIRFALSSQLERASASLLAVRLPTLNVEANLFRQVLQNLIENSIKYRSSGQKLWIHVKYQPLENGHEIAVEDNGIGITKEKAEKLFDLFAQGSHAAPGLGIGLSLCKRIIDLHGGTIAFDTSFENGSRVVITLPKDAVK